MSGTGRMMGEGVSEAGLKPRHTPAISSVAGRPEFLHWEPAGCDFQQMVYTSCILFTVTF